MTTPKTRFKQQWRILRLLTMRLLEKVSEDKCIYVEAERIGIDDKIISVFFIDYTSPDRPFITQKNGQVTRWYKDRILSMQLCKRTSPLHLYRCRTFVPGNIFSEQQLIDYKEGVQQALSGLKGILGDR